MSHTAIPGFCVRSRPRCPLAGGNVAALQHEGRVRSGRPARSSGAEARGSRRPSARAPGERRPARGLGGPRDGLHRPCCCCCCTDGPPGPRPRTSWGGGGGGRGRPRQAWGPAGAQAAAASGLPGTWRASPRPGAGPAPQAGTDRARRYPGAARGSRLAGSWSLDARAPRPRLLSTPAASPQGRPPEGRISGTAAAELSADGEVGVGGWGGRLARRLRERPGGPGLGPPQPPPLAASGASSGCARRGRKLSDLASAGRHSDSD